MFSAFENLVGSRLDVKCTILLWITRYIYLNLFESTCVSFLKGCLFFSLLCEEFLNLLPFFSLLAQFRLSISLISPASCTILKTEVWASVMFSWAFKSDERICDLVLTINHTQSSVIKDKCLCLASFLECNVSWMHTRPKLTSRISGYDQRRVSFGLVIW